jgi:hypothetical protein
MDESDYEVIALTASPRQQEKNSQGAVAAMPRVFRRPDGIATQSILRVRDAMETPRYRETDGRAMLPGVETLTNERGGGGG